MFADIRLHVAWPYTSSADSLFSLIYINPDIARQSSLVPSSSLPPPLYAHSHSPFVLRSVSLFSSHAHTTSTPFLVFAYSGAIQVLRNAGGGGGVSYFLEKSVTNV